MYMMELARILAVVAKAAVVAICCCSSSFCKSSCCYIIVIKAVFAKAVVEKAVVAPAALAIKLAESLSYCPAVPALSPCLALRSESAPHPRTTLFSALQECSSPEDPSFRSPCFLSPVGRSTAQAQIYTVNDSAPREQRTITAKASTNAAAYETHPGESYTARREPLSL
ncbi:hypothetical protein Tco_0438727 [Tanacetum coccineum]